MVNNMTELKLVNEEQPEKKIDWKVERVNIFLEEFKKARPKDKYPLGYPAMMGMMYRMWTTVHGYTDEETGEIIFDIPDVETWREQAKGFFQDKFARETRKFHFDYFIKQFGSFKVIEEDKQIPTTHYKCQYCRQLIRLTARDGHRYVCPQYPKEKLY